MLPAAARLCLAWMRNVPVVPVSLKLRTARCMLRAAGSESRAVRCAALQPHLVARYMLFCLCAACWLGCACARRWSNRSRSRLRSRSRREVDRPSRFDLRGLGFWHFAPRHSFACLFVCLFVAVGCVLGLLSERSRVCAVRVRVSVCAVRCSGACEAMVDAPVAPAARASAPAPAFPAIPRCI